MDKSKNLTIVIPAAGLGRRMKSYGPKSLIALGNGQTILSRQLDILHATYPKAEIILVLGYEAEKVYKVIPSYVRVVENEFYDETNVARSIALGVRAGKDVDKLLVVYGDLVFNAATFSNHVDSSHVIVDTKGQMLETEVGLFAMNNYATQFSYGLPMKWAHIAYLTGKELDLFKSLLDNSKYKKFYGFELMNLLLEHNGRLKIIEPSEMQITEIDTSKDIERATEMLKKEIK